MYASSSCCFSNDDAAWGAGNNVVNGGNSGVASSFWGIANFNAGDYRCNIVFSNGIGTAYANAKSVLAIPQSCVQCPSGTGSYAVSEG